MKHKNTTKRTLALSLLVMLMCVAMLVGTTFAWFTDSATSSGNKIEAGTLNIDLLVKNAAGEYQSVKQDKTAIFNYDKWEPGYTEVKNVMVKTDGNLALKYTLSIVPKSSTTPADLKLAEVIDVYYASSEVNVTDRNLTGLTRIGTLKDVLNGVEGTVINDTLIPGQQNTVDYATIALKMQESAGNDYQGLSVGEGFDLNLVATQYTYEKDSFDNQYDAGAEYAIPVATAADLAAALANGQDVVLTAPVTMPDAIEITGDVTIYGSENGKLIAPDNGNRIIKVNDNTEPVTLTLSGVEVVGPTTGTDTRGVSVYNNRDVTIIVDNSSVSASYYALSIANDNDSVDVVVKNTTLTGWCAFQTWSAGTKATFENCTLIGNNDKGYNADGWNDFATIVINKDVSNTELTFNNCRIEANQTTGNKQYLLSVRAHNAKVTLDGCTFFANGTEIADEDFSDYLEIYYADLVLTIDGEVIPIG